MKVQFRLASLNDLVVSIPLLGIIIATPFAIEEDEKIWEKLSSDENSKN